MTDPLLLLQLGDSAFPTGGFAHSWGLEAAYQAGEATAANLSQVLEEGLWQAGRGGLPWLTAAFDDPRRLETLDEAADAFLVNPIANRASRVQGRAFVAACARTFPGEAMTRLDVRLKLLRGHQAPAMGAALSTLRVSRVDAQRLYLFQGSRGLLSAAVRLGIVGPYAAQELQHACAPLLTRVLDTCGDLTDDDAAQTSPVLDILQGAHDRLYSRLFQS